MHPHWVPYGFYLQFVQIKVDFNLDKATRLHSSFSNSSGAHEEFELLKNLMSTNITKISMELFQSPKKTFYVIITRVPFSFTDSTNQCKALHVILNWSDVDIFLGGSRTAPWKF